MSAKIKSRTKKLLSNLCKLLGLSSLFSFLGCNSIFGIFTGNGPYVCMYGVPDNIIEIDGTVYGDIDGDGTEEPVPDIKVSNASTGKEVFTDSEGKFYYSSREFGDSITLTFCDVDDDKNGSFDSTSNTYDLTESYYQIKDIHLKNKTNE